MTKFPNQQSKELNCDLKTLDLVAQTMVELTVPPQIILLSGALGAGKTQFSQFFAKALGVAEVVSSPSFVKMNRYPLPAQGFLAHLDGYHVTSETASSFIDYFEDDFVLVEWPKVFSVQLEAKNTWKIYFRAAEPNRRHIKIEAPAEICRKIESLFNEQV